MGILVLVVIFAFVTAYLLEVEMMRVGDGQEYPKIGKANILMRNSKE